jgi:hypothetical protein
MTRNRLSTKLCRLFDGGYTDINTFARLSGESPRTIEWLTNRPGARIDRETEFRISKTLAAFCRKFPELQWDVAPPEKRGAIVEVETHRKDEKSYELYDSSGEWLGTWTCPASDAEIALEGLNRHLMERDKGRLKVMPCADAGALHLPASQSSRVS